MPHIPADTSLQKEAPACKKCGFENVKDAGLCHYLCVWHCCSCLLNTISGQPMQSCRHVSLVES